MADGAVSLRGRLYRHCPPTNRPLPLDSRASASAAAGERPGLRFDAPRTR